MKEYLDFTGSLTNECISMGFILYIMSKIIRDKSNLG